MIIDHHSIILSKMCTMEPVDSILKMISKTNFKLIILLFISLALDNLDSIFKISAFHLNLIRI